MGCKINLFNRSMTYIMFGTKVFENYVQGGIERQAYCGKCQKMSWLVEYEFQKAFHIWFWLQLKSIGKPVRFLKCLACGSRYDIDYGLKENESVDKDLKPLLVNALKEIKEVEGIKR